MENVMTTGKKGSNWRIKYGMKEDNENKNLSKGK
jgi:hypothetical protein